MKRIKFSLIAFLLTCVSAFSQAPKYSNEFLAIGVGARGLAMSGSQVSVTNDVTAGYWNPAGLTLIPSGLQIGLMHAEYFAGIAKYDYGAIAARIDQNSAGAFTFIRFAVDDIPNTTELIDADGNIDYDRITTFSAADYAFMLSYARDNGKIKGLRYGANVKVVHRKVGDFARSWGFGVDLGVQYDYKKWKFGAMARDITTTFNAWSYDLPENMIQVFTQTGNEIPENSLELTLPKLILGAGRRFDVKKFSALVVIDLDMTFDGKRNVLIKSDPISIDPHAGLEFGYNEIIFLRGGFGNIQKETDFDNKLKTTFQPNIGVGFVIRKLVAIDYALTDVGNASIALYSHIFSLKLNVNKRVEPTDGNKERKNSFF